MYICIYWFECHQQYAHCDPRLSGSIFTIRCLFLTSCIHVGSEKGWMQTGAFIKTSFFSLISNSFALNIYCYCNCILFILIVEIKRTIRFFECATLNAIGKCCKYATKFDCIRFLLVALNLSNAWFCYNFKCSRFLLRFFQIQTIRTFKLSGIVRINERKNSSHFSINHGFSMQSTHATNTSQ